MSHIHMNSLDYLPADLWDEAVPRSPFFRLHDQLRAIFLETEKSLLAGENADWEACWRRQALLLKDIRFSCQRTYAQGFWFKALLFSNLSSTQLRTYLDWRTRWQNHTSCPPVSSSFLRLYAMEVILRIRGETDAQAAEKMLELTRAPICDDDLGASFVLRRLLQDFFLTLSPAARENLSGKMPDLRNPIPLDHTIETLAVPEKSSDEAIFETLLAYASRDMEPLRENQRAVHLVAELWRTLHDLEQKKAKDVFSLRFWGTYRTQRYNLFEEFPFHQLNRQKDLEELICIRPDFFWRCRDGRWSKIELHANILKLTGLVRDIFLVVCRYLHWHNRKIDEDRERKIPAKIAKAFQETISREKKKERARIDYSLLPKIRELARETEKNLSLSTDSEERESSTVAEKPTAQLPPHSFSCEEQSQSEIGLTKQEIELLKIALSPTPSPLQQMVRHESLSLLVDSINEKLLPLLGDIALTFTGQDIKVVPDYAEEVEKLLNPYKKKTI